MPNKDIFPKKVTIWLKISGLDINTRDTTKTEVSRDFQASTWYVVHEIENKLLEFLGRLHRHYTPIGPPKEEEKDAP